MMVPVRKWDGKPISEPGIYSDMPIEVYHSAHCCNDYKISSSGLKRIIIDSPAHYWLESPYNPNRAQPKVGATARHFRRGKAAHALLLGSEEFSSHYIIRPAQLLNPETGKMRKWHGNNTECKAWLAQVPKGIEVLDEDDVEAVRGMAMSLGRNEVVNAGLLNGRIELSMFWRDPETGLWKSARPDVIPTDSGDFADLKSTSSVQYFDMQRSLKDYGYAQQAAMVREGALALGLTFEHYVLVFVENDAPFCVATEELKQSAIDLGAAMNLAGMRRFAECIGKYGTDENSVWPGPRGEQQDLEYIDFSDRDRHVISERLRYEFGIEVEA